MTKETYVCDVCGVERKEANHWWVADLGEIGERYVEDCKILGLVLMPWNSEAAQESGINHLCGQACVHKFVDEFLSK